MATWRDVMNARREADGARQNANAYGGAVEEGRSESVALAVILAAEAIVTELRALATLADFARGDAQ